MANTTLNLTDQRLSREQNKLVTALGKFAASDSASIQVITIITLVFLVFTVVSVGQIWCIPGNYMILTVARL